MTHHGCYGYYAKIAVNLLPLTKPKNHPKLGGFSAQINLAFLVRAHFRTGDIIYQDLPVRQYLGATFQHG